MDGKGAIALVFSSLAFLFGFLPTVLIVYNTVPKRWKNPLLFFASLVFYGWVKPVYILLMMLSITTAYALAFPMKRALERKNKSKAKAVMLLSVGINLSFLFFFKYYNFLAGSLSLPIIVQLTLPVGISFYTFQIVSYTADVYRGDCDLQRNFVAFGTYVTLFPQLIAGPIVRYRDVDRQLTERQISLADLSAGISRFCVGLSKKVLLGDGLAAGYAYFKAMQTVQPTVLGAWSTVILYTLHLYFDFSGYSDMAIGLGKLFGFTFPENFNYPYIAKSITDFWRRWHITLSTWFREYVYIPMGGNRVGKAKLYRNLAVVWLLTGIWHGANWNFLLWGVYYAVILILEKAFLGNLLEKAPAFLRHFYTCLLVTFGFLIFSFTDFAEGISCAKALVGIGTVGFASEIGVYQIGKLLPLILLSGLGATPIPKTLFEKVRKKLPFGDSLVPILSAISLLLCTAYLVSSSYSPFEYFIF